MRWQVLKLTENGEREGGRGGVVIFPKERELSDRPCSQRSLRDACEVNLHYRGTEKQNTQENLL